MFSQLKRVAIIFAIGLFVVLCFGTLRILHHDSNLSVALLMLAGAAVANLYLDQSYKQAPVPASEMTEKTLSISGTTLWLCPVSATSVACQVVIFATLASPGHLPANVNGAQTTIINSMDEQGSTASSYADYILRYEIC